MPAELSCIVLLDFSHAAEYAQVTCIYLFHELPPSVRREAAAEMARVVRPGGMVVLTDSAQFGDRPPWDAVNACHSMLSKVRAPLKLLICACGLMHDVQA